MDIYIVDRNGNPIDQSQLEHLNVWNLTLEHVCASTLQRLRELEDCDKPLSVETTEGFVV